jgi:hypothetical protein
MSGWENHLSGTEHILFPKDPLIAILGFLLFFSNNLFSLIYEEEKKLCPPSLL